jgi:hypothetical protein
MTTPQRALKIALLVDRHLREMHGLTYEECLKVLEGVREWVDKFKDDYPKSTDGELPCLKTRGRR